MTTARMTLEEFLALPETEPASEFECGEVYQKPMPDEWHSALQSYFILLFFTYNQRTKLGRFGPEWRCVFGPPDDIRPYVPDVLFVTNERYDRGRPHRARLLHTAPDVVVEILSPNQPMDRFSRKLAFYLAHGVRLVWVVDPEQRTITVHRPGAVPRVLRAGDTLDGAEVLPGFTAEVAEIFAQLRDD